MVRYVSYDDVIGRPQHVSPPSRLRSFRRAHDRVVEKGSHFVKPGISTCRVYPVCKENDGKTAVGISPDGGTGETRVPEGGLGKECSP